MISPLFFPLASSASHRRFSFVSLFWVSVCISLSVVCMVGRFITISIYGVAWVCMCMADLSFPSFGEPSIGGVHGFRGSLLILVPGSLSRMVGPHAARGSTGHRQHGGGTARELLGRSSFAFGLGLVTYSRGIYPCITCIVWCLIGVGFGVVN